MTWLVAKVLDDSVGETIQKVRVKCILRTPEAVEEYCSAGLSTNYKNSKALLARERQGFLFFARMLTDTGQDEDEKTFSFFHSAVNTRKS